MTELILNHLWQSTLFVGGAWLVNLALRNNGAQSRFWVWFAASIKFLIPFAALTAAGGYFLTPMAPKIAAPILLLMQPAAQPFSSPMPLMSAPVASAAPHLDMFLLVLLVWALGFCAIVARWTFHQLQLLRLLHNAVILPAAAPVRIKIASSSLEPGLVGIWRPVILLPHGIIERLSAEELDAILAHELCHWQRRDNLLAAIHMLVEALFWFHPLVWWLGKRMIAERERACDESVLASGKNAKIYAESILKVCKLYLHSPLICAAGVSGADLKQRLEEIVENKFVQHLKNTKKALLAAAALLAVGSPMALGLLQVPQALAQATDTTQVIRVVPDAEKDIVNKAPITGPAPNRVKFIMLRNNLMTTLTADTTEGKVPHMQYKGNVTLSMPSAFITADAATMDGDTHTMTVNGTVVLLTGMGIVRGKQLTFNTDTGVINMNGQNTSSGFPKPSKPGPNAKKW